jgi:hypothetical protein
LHCGILLHTAAPWTIGCSSIHRSPATASCTACTVNASCDILISHSDSYSFVDLDMASAAVGAVVASAAAEIPQAAASSALASFVPSAWHAALHDVLATALDYPWSVASVAGSVAVFALVSECARAHACTRHCNRCVARACIPLSTFLEPKCMFSPVTLALASPMMPSQSR